MRTPADIAEAEHRLITYASAAAAVEEAFRKVEALAPKPTAITWGDGIKFRYGSAAVEFALLLKLARLCSLLNSLLYFVNTGLIQEQCIIQRVIEETEEDINFLTLAICGDGLTARHESFLAEFWKEDYSDPTDPVGSRIARAYSRRGIRSFVHRSQGQDDPHAADENGRAIYELYSGFLHGSAPHIMELFDPESGRFQVNGMGMTPIHIDYIHDAQNSYYRGLLSTAMLLKALGLPEVLAVLMEAIQKFENDIGIEYLQKAPI